MARCQNTSCKSIGCVETMNRFSFLTNQNGPNPGERSPVANTSCPNDNLCVVNNKGSTMRQPSLRLGLVALLVILVIAPVSADTQPPLQIKVFNALEDHMGLGVNSAIIYGEKDAVLVDAQFTLSNAHRLVADILETNKAAIKQ